MKLLVLSQFFPYPPNNGSRLRVYNLLKDLAQRHDIRLLSFRQDEDHSDGLRALRQICEDVKTVPCREFRPNGLRALVGFCSLRPRSSVDLWDPGMSQLVEHEIKHQTPDAIIAFTLRCGEYVADYGDIPKIMDLENADGAYINRLGQAQSAWLSRLRLKLTWMKLVRHERRLTTRFDAVLTVSEEDRCELIRTAPELASRGTAFVVPNGVDLSLLDYQGPPREPNRIIYSGSLTYNANYDACHLFCREILPLIRERMPHANFVITGSHEQVDISPFVKAGAELTGLVPDIRPEVARSSVLAVPLRFGGGTRLKILEAMALGTPVVSTTVGAMGMNGVSGKHLILVDDPGEFADAVCTVLSDRSLAMRLSSEGRQLVADHFGWDTISSKLETILQNIGSESGMTCTISAEG